LNELTQRLFEEALHYEFNLRGVYVTVVRPPLTNTAVLAKLGFDPRTMHMKPMSVEQCVSEGLNALRKNRSRIVPGRLNRFIDAFVPAFVKRTMTAKMLGKALARKAASARARPNNGRVMNRGAPVNWIAADILRIEDGLLVEHWDVIQDEATEEQSKSVAPMFGKTFPKYK
jgi:hypothetical protein